MKGPEGVPEEEPQKKTIEKVFTLVKEIMTRHLETGDEFDYGAEYTLERDGVEYNIFIHYDFKKAGDKTLKDDPFVVDIMMSYDAGTAYHSERFAIRKSGKAVRSLETDASVKEAGGEAYSVDEQAEIIATPDQTITVPTTEGDMEKLTTLLEELKKKSEEGGEKDED